MSPYRIAISGSSRQQFLDLCRQEYLQNRLDPLLASYDEAIAQLHSNPENVGEPLYVLQHLGLEVRIVILPPLVVHVGLDKARRIVYIKDFALMN